ncbi:MAG: histidine kinase N-terminal 7TM domain-containing protein [Candidatus Portnoybacteria bacterium]|nr:histidine kinase N-terminal 7TM domain-containing protein [Candidatus Portnoybacteria bacterium]
MISYYALAALINGIASTFLGILVYRNKKKDAANLGFLFFCVCVSFWSYSYFIWQISTTAESALFWTKMLMAGAIFVPATYLHFVLGLLEKASQKKKTIIFVYLIFSIFLVLDFTSSNFITGVSPALSFKFWPQRGVLYSLFLSIWSFFMFFSIFLLYKDFRKSTGMKRTQIKLVLIGFATSLIGALTNFPLWYDIPIPPIGNITTVAYMGLTAYSILRHRLFEAKIITTDLLVGLMGVVLLMLPFLMPSLPLIILTSITFLLFCVFGYFLIKATYGEIMRREEAQKLAASEAELKQKALWQAKALKELSETLEQKVRERTRELENSKNLAEEKNKELEKYYRLMIGRELKMVELKKELEKKKEETEKLDESNILKPNPAL